MLSQNCGLIADAPKRDLTLDYWFCTVLLIVGHAFPLLSNARQWGAILEQKLNYIHHNPVESEIVDEPEYYWYSSARDYLGKKGLLDINILE